VKVKKQKDSTSQEIFAVQNFVILPNCQDLNKIVVVSYSNANFGGLQVQLGHGSSS